MGEYKWEELNKKYILKDTQSPTDEEVEEVKKIFKSRGIEVH